jgi:methionyl-tRNA formyltransferase
MTLRALFMGSPDFAVPSLEALAGRHQVTLVLAQPDKPAGRGRHLLRPAVAEAADRLGIPVLQPVKMKDPALWERLAAERPDVIVVAAYGRILPPEILRIPRLGCINVHGSILPRHRGAAPIQWALIHGDAETGVAIMHMDEGLDTGPVLLMRRLSIGEDDTSGSLHLKLAELGAGALLEALDGVAAGTLKAVPQAELPGSPSLAPRLEKSAGVLDFGRPAAEVAARARGVDPWPAATAVWRGEVVRLFGPRRREWPGQAGAAPGTLASAAPGTLAFANNELVVACGDGGAVGFGEVQRPGKKRLRARDVLAGRPLVTDDRLVPPGDGGGDGAEGKGGGASG